MSATWHEGPYWLATETNGEHHVRGKNGVTLFKYRADQLDLANVRAKRLQDEWAKGDRLLKAAAPDLLQRLSDLVLILDAIETHMELEDGEKQSLEMARAAISKATGQPYGRAA